MGHHSNTRLIHRGKTRPNQVRLLNYLVLRPIHSWQIATGDLCSRAMHQSCGENEFDPLLPGTIVVPSDGIVG